MRVLISGASISGPVLAYWLRRYGFTVTVVERSPTPRKTGGHAVDLFRPAMDISEKMGVLARIEQLDAGMGRMNLVREGARRPVPVDLGKVYRATSDRHVEIMRDDLSEVYYDATRDDVEYLFGDSIASVDPDDGAVTFDHAAPRRFDLVIGADGLRSNVRRLVFGTLPGDTVSLDGYFGVLSVPREFGVVGEYIGHMGPRRTVGLYAARHLPDARAVFLFRPESGLSYHHRDVSRQKQLVREAFTGMHPRVDRWLGELDTSPTFYFDQISQLRMDTWSRGRVTLVGDAGYCPGPVVGGSTSLAVLGAYTLAGELARAGGDPARAFPAYEAAMREPVQRSRAFALGAAHAIHPNTRLGVWALVQAARLVTALPTAISAPLARLNTKGLRMHDSFPVREYPAPVR
ncbi:FAD-dependent monooxygenase [Pseudonocardia eucalypti]|uniref:FAD-dependent monooxygenase n=1 Tax=Pseudonocardia eucalypti TaxID=648755 RepID=A0ABP9R8I4_9PSEU|nr:2-polyprenyl-6-methoxyphenol hydroxylase-like FAD-dependent oxidoreductase [Pseudonocardia eucalypti]